MKRLVPIILSIVIGLATASAGDFAGTWRGELNVGQKLTIFYNISTSPDTIATLDSPMQGALGIPCSETIISGREITIRTKSLSATFTGEMQDDSATIAGTFSQAWMKIPLTLTRSSADEITLNRPQTPHPPYFYNTEDVTFTHDSITLAGTLTTPSWITARHPAVVLVSGSGAQNRDEELFGHRPFAVIADHLTRSGIAVLRYDDRGVGGSSPGKSTDTTFDFATDAEAALDFLRSRSDINPDHIGIIGHSEGGTIAMIVAAKRQDDVDFIVSLAGAAVKGKEILINQNFKQYELSGRTPTADETSQIHAIFDAIETTTDTDSLTQKLRTIIARPGSISAGQDIERNIKVMTSPWYTAFVRFDPTATMRQIKCPVLAINGEWDFQVDADTNLEAIASVIPTATTKLYPRLNHMLQESSSLIESINYGAISQTISPQVLTDISAWIIDTTR